MPMRRLALALGFLVVLVLPGPLAARCRPSTGDQLVVITPRAGHGVVLLQRVPAYADRGVITGATPATLTIRRRDCTSGCVSQQPLREIAPNLYAMSAGRTTGHYDITTDGARGTFDNAHTFTAPTPVSVAPVGPSIDRQMVGTGFFAPTIALAAPAPADVVGLLARWQGSSFFMPVGSTERSHFLLFPGRCRTALPGYVPPTPGTAMEVVFVDAEGSLSPAASVTLRDVSITSDFR